MTDWIVLGAGGHARSVVDALVRRGDRLVAVCGRESRPWSVPVIDSEDEAFDLAHREGAAVALAIGDGGVRLAMLEKVLAVGLSAPVLIASSATVASDADLDTGVVVLEHAHVGSGAQLGAGVLINTAAVVEHDCTVGAGSHAAPAAVLLGEASSGALVVVGAGAVVLPGVHLGDRAVVGAGSIVRVPVDPGRTVVGVPARPRGA